MRFADWWDWLVCPDERGAPKTREAAIREIVPSGSPLMRQAEAEAAREPLAGERETMDSLPDWLGRLNLRADGFLPWREQPPQRGTWIEAWRHEWECVEMPWARPTAIWRTGDESPEMNVAGLWWRPLLESGLEPAVAADDPCDDWTPVPPC